MHRFAVNSIVQLQRFSANKPHRSPSLSQYTACPGQPDSGAKIFRYQSWPRSDIQAQVQRLAWQNLNVTVNFFDSRPGSGGQKLSRVLSWHKLPTLSLKQGSSPYYEPPCLSIDRRAKPRMICVISVVARAGERRDSKIWVCQTVKFSHWFWRQFFFLVLHKLQTLSLEARKQPGQNYRQRPRPWLYIYKNSRDNALWILVVLHVVRICVVCNERIGLGRATW